MENKHRVVLEDADNMANWIEKIVDYYSTYGGCRDYTIQQAKEAKIKYLRSRGMLREDE